MEVATHTLIQCDAPHKCSNCDGPHPSTARTCPVYLAKLLEHEEILLEQLVKKHPELVKSILNKFQIQISPQSDAQDITSILRAARLASHSPEDFNNQLFNATQFLVNNSPPLNNSYNDKLNLVFDCELDEGDEASSFNDALNNTSEIDINNTTLFSNIVPNTTRNSNVSFHVNQDIVVEQPNEYIPSHIVKEMPPLTTDEDFHVFSQQEFKTNEKQKGIYPSNCILQTKSNLGNKMFCLVHIYFSSLMNLLILAGTNASQTYDFTKHILLDQILNIKFLEEHEILIIMKDSKEYLLKIFKGWNGSSKEKTRDPDGAQAIIQHLNLQPKLPSKTIKTAQTVTVILDQATHGLTPDGVITTKEMIIQTGIGLAGYHTITPATTATDKKVFEISLMFDTNNKKLIIQRYDSVQGKYIRHTINGSDIKEMTIKEHIMIIKENKNHLLKFYASQEKQYSPEITETVFAFMQNNICEDLYSD